MPLRNQFNSEAEWLNHLRLYFAAKAMQGWIASGPSLKAGLDETTDHPLDGSAKHAEILAEVAYGFADAMLAAREVQS